MTSGLTVRLTPGQLDALVVLGRVDDYNRAHSRREPIVVIGEVGTSYQVGVRGCVRTSVADPPLSERLTPMPNKTEPFEYVRDFESDPDAVGNVVFDRVVYVPHLYGIPLKPRHGPLRLRLFWDPESPSFTSIAEEEVTSEERGAQVVEGRPCDEVEVNEHQVRWLHDQLGQLIARWDREAAGPTASGAPR